MDKTFEQAVDLYILRIGGKIIRDDGIKYYNFDDVDLSKGTPRLFEEAVSIVSKSNNTVK